MPPIFALPTPINKSYSIFNKTTIRFIKYPKTNKASKLALFVTVKTAKTYSAFGFSRSLIFNSRS